MNHRGCRATFRRVNSSEGGIQHFVRFQRNKFATHDTFHQPVRPVLLQRDHQVATRKNADDSRIFQHRKVLLRSRQDQLNGPSHGIFRPERVEVGHHCPADWNASQRGFHGHHARFLSRADPHEESDEQQERISKEA